ncbi:MAG: hypothetical protein ACM3UZ_14390 [Acidobacteriota bacterium]
MAYARWKKILADVWSNKARPILAALSIAVGIFAVGVVLVLSTLASLLPARSAVRLTIRNVLAYESEITLEGGFTALFAGNEASFHRFNPLD